MLLCRAGLHSTVHHYLSSCGLTVHTTFGLPETSGLLTANIPNRFCKLGTAGKQLPGISLNLEQRPTEDEAGDDVESDSEMTVYGRNVFMGYLNREKDIKV